MNGGWWVLIIAGGIILAFIGFYILYFVFAGGVIGVVSIIKWVDHLRYAHRAKKHNKRARELRLEKTTWHGFPLPTGKEGTLRITKKMLTDNFDFVSTFDIDKQYEDRARDLHVDLYKMYDAMTGDTLIRWKPAKGRRPRERY